MTILSKTLFAVLLLTITVSLCNPLNAKDKDVGEWKGCTNHAETVPCPQSASMSTETVHTVTDHYENCSISYTTTHDCYGGATTTQPDTTWKRISTGGGPWGVGKPVANLNDLNWRNWQNRIKFYVDMAQKCMVIKSPTPYELVGYGLGSKFCRYITDSINVTIYETVSNGATITLLDTTILTTGNDILPINFDLNYNQFFIIDRSADEPTPEVIAKIPTSDNVKPKFISYRFESKVNDFVTTTFDAAAAINVYPNPVRRNHDNINISLDDEECNGTLEVLATNRLTGEIQVVHTINIIPGVTLYEVNTDALPTSGPYGFMVVGRLEKNGYAYPPVSVHFLLR